MKALVLAAGKGERFRPFRDDIPKPMIELAGKPVLEHVLCHLHSSGIRSIIINLHHRPEAIMDYFGDGRRWGVSIEYSVEPELLGTAGAAKKVAGLLGRTFMVYYGDNLCSCDLRGLRDFHGEKGGVGTIVVAESYDDVVGGVIEFDSNCRVLSFAEKPPSSGVGTRWENGGIYVLEAGVLEYVPEGRQSDFARDIFPALLDAGEKVYCYRAEGYVRGVDTPERFLMVRKELEEGRIGPIC